VTRDDRTHQAIVARLLGELTPVRPLWPPWMRLACWLVLAFGVVALAAAVGLRDDLGVEMERPRYLFDLAILLAGAGLAATLALLAAVPGRIGGRRARSERWEPRISARWCNPRNILGGQRACAVDRSTVAAVRLLQRERPIFAPSHWRR